MSNNQFLGLTMPVFTAFGWAGEETAINFALSQLELFIDALYYSLPRETQAFFPAHGLDKASKSVFLATNPEPETGLYIAFHARPASLEISLEMTDKVTLSKAYKAAEAQAETFFGLLTVLGAGWNLRFQQMEYDLDSNTATNYQDLFKDSIGAIKADSLAAMVARAAFLNSEDQWLVPLYISRRTDSEKVAAMSTAIIPTVAEDIEKLMPLAGFLTGKAKKQKARKAPSAKAQPAEIETVEERPAPVVSLDQFTYESELKPLHLRRGFINLTPQHWPFFAVNIRTETRPITIHYGNKTDEKSAVWRLVPNDQARIVLSPAVHEWLEDNFEPEDRILVTAVKPDRDRIFITLQPVG